MNHQAVMTTAGRALALSPTQLNTLKQTIAHDTDLNEFDLYMEVVKATGLDPFRKQVIPLIFSKDNPEKRRMSIVVTQDGLRVLAARCGDYRPSEEEPEFTYRDDLKGPNNPLGIEKCVTTLWKQDNQGKWHPVKGWAYWEEYAPLKEIWAPNESNVRKPTGKFELEKGNWTKMGRVMIAKCATMQGLRAGWPDTFGGLYAEEEMHRAQADDMSASQIVEEAATERRRKLIDQANDEYPWVALDGILRYVPAGRFHDHVMGESRTYTDAAQIDAMRTRNADTLKRFWASHKDEALDLRAKLDEAREQLSRPVLEHV